MKKIKLASGEKDIIKFLVRGQRGSANALLLEIDSEGVVVNETDADLVKERLGSSVSIEDINLKEAAEDINKLTAEEIAAKAAEKKAKEDAKAAKAAAKKAATNKKPN